MPADNEDPPSEEAIAKAVELVKGCWDEQSQETLDEFVLEVASHMASTINNEGVESQVGFLMLAGVSPESIVKILTDD